MAIPRRETVDGFEMQFGTNHLGHFALTGLLVGSMRPGGPRGHGLQRRPPVRPDGLRRPAGRGSRTRSGGRTGRASWPTSCSPSSCTVGPSAADVDLRSVAVHPGYAATNLQSVGPQMSGSRIGVDHDVAGQPRPGPVGRGRRLADADGDHGSRRPQRHATSAPRGSWASVANPDSRPPRRPPGTLDSARRLWDVSTDADGCLLPLVSTSGTGFRRFRQWTAGRVTLSRIAPLAQSAERLHGKEKVYGSIP